MSNYIRRTVTIYSFKEYDLQAFYGLVEYLRMLGFYQAAAELASSLYLAPWLVRSFNGKLTKDLAFAI
jgi:hypothetical protein